MLSRITARVVKTKRTREPIRHVCDWPCCLIGPGCIGCEMDGEVFLTTLGHGLRVLREEAQEDDSPVCSGSSLVEKLSEDLHLECKKFTLYRAHHLPERQWFAVQRIRALLQILTILRTC